jgi:ubiquinone/menaquinone biosynthesis C-methylase UbiE
VANTLSLCALINPPCRSHKPEGAKRIRYVHGLAEACGLPDASVDLVVFGFVFHECPEGTIRDLVREARRVLRRGGVLMVTDTDPKCVDH